MAKRSSSSATGAPSEEAREALAKWGLALRYASAAVRPAAKQAATGVKQRIAKATSGDGSLKERLNPAKTGKGGRIGDGADALLEKLGTPGKLAARASLGSRAVDRLTPDLAESGEEDDRVTDLPETEEEEEAVLEERQAAQADASDEDQEPPEEDEEQREDDPQASDESDEPASEADADEDEAADKEEIADEAEPVQAHEGAAPLHTDFEHAYSEEVENYVHRDAYASRR